MGNPPGHPTDFSAVATAAAMAVLKIQAAETAISCGDLARSIAYLGAAHKILSALIGQVEALEGIAETTAEPQPDPTPR